MRDGGPTTTFREQVLRSPALYHSLRQFLTGGMPFRRWTALYGLNDRTQRIADIGCGPADILRYVHPGEGPGFYLGIDLSQRYLDVAARHAERSGSDHRLIRMDLDRLHNDETLQEELRGLLERHGITRVLLLGVLHHLSDEAALLTLDRAHDVPSVQSVVTSDVVYRPDATLNNLLCDWDRGSFVRDEDGYDDLVRRSPWPLSRKTVTHPGFSFIQYLHYLLTRIPATTSARREASIGSTTD
jgi:SAM-dependent methyltransferase